MPLLVVHDKARHATEEAIRVKTAPPAVELWKRFDAAIAIDTPAGKTFREIKGADNVITDYLDVTIRGYLSTFADATESDRQGEYVRPGAFADTLAKFMTNPVMLRDHVNMTAYLAGRFTKMQEDARGLYVEAMVSNAPDCRDLRFKLAEGHLRTMSIGGMWHYLEDGRGIFRVDLFEGSLTPVPANPKAVITTRSLKDEDVKHLKRLGLDNVIVQLGLKDLPTGANALAA